MSPLDSSGRRSSYCDDICGVGASVTQLSIKWSSTGGACLASRHGRQFLQFRTHDRRAIPKDLWEDRSREKFEMSAM